MNQEWSAQGQVGQALRAVIADFGPQVLGNPDMLGNLLRDHLPDNPRETRVLAAAAQSGAAAAVDERIRSGMQPAAAVRMTAIDLTNSLAIDPAAAEWAVGEFAQALGYSVQPAADAAAAADPALATGIPTVADAQVAAPQYGGQQQAGSPQFGATIGAQAQPYAGQQQAAQPPPGYGQQQQYYAPPQPPPARPKSHGPVIAAVCAVVVVVAAVSGFLATRHSTPPLTGANCLAGSWSLQSAHETLSFTGFGDEVWDYTSGSDDWSFGSAGTGTVTDSQFLFTTAPSATTRGRYVSTAAGPFDYHVVGGQIQYSHVSVPGTISWLNLSTGKKQGGHYKSTWSNAPDQFSCSGNTLRRYGTGYSFTYTRQ